jgi:protein KTI12
MPLIVICGHPCSGKTTIAKRIAEACKEKGSEVIHVDEASLHLVRDASYKGTTKSSF